MALIFQHEEILPNELAAMEKITTQSMSQILSNLLNLGLIKRRISELDKRKVIISLSEEGITSSINQGAKKTNGLTAP
jgi:DNA-binding MarR family transcriptional regulator